MKIDVEWLNDDACVITLTPGWLGRLVGARTRRGDVIRDPERVLSPMYYSTIWVWKVTGESVSPRILRAMRATPVDPYPSVVVTRRQLPRSIDVVDG